MAGRDKLFLKRFLKISLKLLSELKHPRYLIFLLITAFVIIKLALVALRTHPILWDEAVYLAIGKYIYSYGASGLNESFRPFLLPAILGSFWKLGAGPDAYILLSDLLLIAFSAACIYLVFLIGAGYFNERIGLISAGLMAFSPLFFYNSSRIMTEVPAIFFILLSVFLLSKEMYGWAGLCSGAAFMFRFPSGIFAAAVALAIVISCIDMARTKSKKIIPGIFGLVKFMITFSLSISAYILVSYYLYGSLFGPLMLAAEHQSTGLYSIPNFWQDIMFYPYGLLCQCLFFVFALTPFIFLIAKPDRRELGRSLLYLALLLPFLYFIYAGNKQIRFAMLYLPFLCLLSSYGFAKTLLFIHEKFSGSNKKLWLKRLLRLSLYIIFLVSVLQAVHYDYKSFVSFPEEEPEIVSEYNKFFSGYPEGTIILTSDPVPAAYSDARFIYFYDSIFRAKDRFEQNIGIADYVVYNPDAIYCEDEVCNAIKEHYISTLMENGTILLEDNYDGEKRVIFRI